MESQQGIITLDNVSIGYRHKSNRQILFSGINVHANQGECIGLAGRNGVGKTTLIKCLVRLLHPLQGSIAIYGRELKKYSLRQLANYISYVSTENVAVEHLSVYGLVSYGRSRYTNILGVHGEADKKAIEQAIASVGLSGYKNRNINELSDGEKKKALIARALAQDTPVIILDEPLAFLDLSNKYELVQLLKYTAHEKNRTVIFSIHDINLALKECDKLWLMEGEEVLEGAPEDLILNRQIQELFRDSGLIFDEQAGQFTYGKHWKTSISMKANGFVAQWTKRALERIGVQVVESDEKSLYIEQKKNDVSWIFENKESKFVFHTIYELIYFLMHNLNQ